MKSLLFVFALSLSAPSAFADEQISLLRCPAVPEGFTKMLTDLNVLKSAIKKEAACEAAEKQVQSLEDLIGDRRTEVEALVERGKSEVLSNQELSTIRTYLEDVTKKVFSTAELLDRNDYCFAEDKKELGLSDLASITLDATALAKAVAGPWAAPVGLGGQALAGILQGLDKVVKTTGYDFEKLDQRQSYVQSLCTYYNYRQDIEHLLAPKRRTAELLQLNRRLKRGLEAISRECASCRAIVDLDAQRDYNPNAGRDIGRMVGAVNRDFRQPLGSYTLQMLNSLRWSEEELARIRTEVANDRSIGRDLISEMKADIDRFLFEKEAPRFIQFPSEKSLALFEEFSSFVMKEGRRLIYAAGSASIPLTAEMVSPMDEVQAIGNVLKLVPALKAKGQTGLVHRIADFERKSTDLLDRTNIAMEAQVSYCSFFQQAAIYGSDLQQACDSDEARKVEMRLARLESLKPLGEEPPALGINTGTKNKVEPVMDWAEGTNKFLDRLEKDPNVFAPIYDF